MTGLAGRKVTVEQVEKRITQIQIEKVQRYTRVTEEVRQINR